MVRRIVIELDMENDDSGLAVDITRMVMDRIDGAVDFHISQEILSGEKQGKLQVPEFLSPYRKGMQKQEEAGRRGAHGGNAAVEHPEDMGHCQESGIETHG